MQPRNALVVQHHQFYIAYTPVAASGSWSKQTATSHNGDRSKRRHKAESKRRQVKTAKVKTATNPIMSVSCRKRYCCSAPWPSKVPSMVG